MSRGLPVACCSCEPDCSICARPGKYIFVSDFLNDRVLRFDFATKQFKDVFVQKGSGGLRGPWGIAFNKYDDPAQPRTFYVASEGTSRCEHSMHPPRGGGHRCECFSQACCVAASFSTMRAMAPSSSNSPSSRASLVALNSTCCPLPTTPLASRRCCWCAAPTPTASSSTTLSRAPLSAPTRLVSTLHGTSSSAPHRLGWGAIRRTSSCPGLAPPECTMQP